MATTPTVEPTSKPLAAVRTETEKTLAEFLTDLRGSPNMMVTIERMAPRHYNGISCFGHGEQVSVDPAWLNDPDAFRDYLAQKWGGTRFRVAFTGDDPITGKKKSYGVQSVSIDGVPLRDGRPLDEPIATARAESLDRDLSRRYVDSLERGRNGDPATNPGVLGILAQSADRRAESAEAAASARVDAMASQLSDARKEIAETRRAMDDLRNRAAEAPTALGATFQNITGQATATANAAVEALRRDLDGARDAIAVQRDKHRDEIAAIRDAHLKELSLLREDHRKELDMARKDARDTADREINRLREDGKNALDTLRADAAIRLADRDREIDRLRVELADAKRQAISQDAALDTAMKNYKRMHELVGKEDEETTTEKVIGALSDPGVQALVMPTLGAVQSILTGQPVAMPPGMPPGALPGAPSGAPPSALPARAFRPRRHVQPMPVAVAPAGGAAPVPATASATVLSPALARFAPMIAQLEHAVAADTPPDNFARGLLTSVDHAVLRGVLQLDVNTLLAQLEAANAVSALATLRGKQYLAAVLERLAVRLADAGTNAAAIASAPPD